MKKIYILLVVIMLVNGVKGQFNINAASTNYTQDFNTLTSGTWTDNTTLTGWYARTDLTASIATYAANTGATTAAGLYAFGVLGTNPLSDRALGYSASNGFTGASGTGKGYMGWRLKNNTGSAISSVTVTWSGEEWRVNGNAVNQSLVLSYQQASTVTSLITGTWTTTASTFTSPIIAGTTALDGNAAANRVANISVVITVAIPAGEEIMLRWEDLNDVGNDHFLAIDDITVNATAGGGSSPTKLVITSINPNPATINSGFSVTVQAQDGTSTASNVAGNTTVNLTKTIGTGTLGGTLSGVILAGTNSITISGVTYNVAENGVQIQAADGAAFLTSGTFTFNVLQAASQLVLVNVPPTGMINTNINTFTVEARRPDNSVDNTYVTPITVNKVSGPGAIGGTTVATPAAGVAIFNAVNFNLAGTYTIAATDGSFTSATSSNIIVGGLPVFTEVILPQYMQGIITTNNNRVPYVYRATISNLIPNVTYRYTNLVGLASDLVSNTGGAGNQIFYNSAGNFTKNTSGTNLSTAGAYGTFTSDATGSYTGWFIQEPSANATRFIPGNLLYARVLLNDGGTGTSVVSAASSTNTITVLNLGATVADATGIYGASHAPDRDLVFLYDNVNATGRPISSTYIENDGTTATSYATFYTTNVDAQSKYWGTLIPNVLVNGIRRIQYMNSSGNNTYGVTSTDGVWPGAVSTVNPTGGTTALLIDRTATGTNGDFIVDNAVTLASSATVYGSLTLNNGILTSSVLNTLTLTNTASTTGASNSSFVDGPVKKVGNTAFTFPVGKSGTGYVPIGVGNYTGTLAPLTDAFTAEYIRSSAAALGPITDPNINHMSVCDYWKLDRSSGSQTADVTLFWNSNSPCNGGTYINDLTKLLIGHFNGVNWNSSSWGFASYAGTTAAGNITWSSVTTYSPFALGSNTNGNPLPIVFNYLNGYKQGSNHLLNWKVTCNATPRLTMTLERSADGSSYTGIYSITADAARCAQPFDYTDAQTLKGMNFYRLKMTDVDGRITYSTTVALLNASKGVEIVNIVPNPITTTGNFKLNVTSAQAVKMNIIITDMQGRVVLSQTNDLINGFNSIDMNVGRLSKGTYTISGIMADEKTRVMRFVKE
jgi:hypothetical protein